MSLPLPPCFLNSPRLPPPPSLPPGQDDEYYFPPLPLARPKKPWAALAAAATAGGGDAADPFASGQASFGVRSGGGGLEEGLVGETQELVEREEEEEVAAGAGGEGEQDEGGRFMVEEMGWPEWPWWPFLADAIETALRSMSLDELNDRMAVSKRDQYSKRPVVHRCVAAEILWGFAVAAVSVVSQTPKLGDYCCAGLVRREPFFESFDDRRGCFLKYSRILTVT